MRVSYTYLRNNEHTIVRHVIAIIHGYSAFSVRVVPKVAPRGMPTIAGGLRGIVFAGGGVVVFVVACASYKNYINFPFLAV